MQRRSKRNQGASPDIPSTPIGIGTRRSKRKSLDTHLTTNTKGTNRKKPADDLFADDSTSEGEEVEEGAKVRRDRLKALRGRKLAKSKQQPNAQANDEAQPAASEESEDIQQHQLTTTSTTAVAAVSAAAEVPSTAAALEPLSAAASVPATAAAQELPSIQQEPDIEDIQQQPNTTTSTTAVAAAPTTAAALPLDHFADVVDDTIGTIDVPGFHHCKLLGYWPQSTVSPMFEDNTDVWDSPARFISTIVMIANEDGTLLPYTVSVSVSSDESVVRNNMCQPLPANYSIPETGLLVVVEVRKETTSEASHEGGIREYVVLRMHGGDVSTRWEVASRHKQNRIGGIIEKVHQALLPGTGFEFPAAKVPPCISDGLSSRVHVICWLAGHFERIRSELCPNNEVIPTEAAFAGKVWALLYQEHCYNIRMKTKRYDKEVDALCLLLTSTVAIKERMCCCVCWSAAPRTFLVSACCYTPICMWCFVNTATAWENDNNDGDNWGLSFKCPGNDMLRICQGNLHHYAIVKDLKKVENYSEYPQPPVNPEGANSLAQRVRVSNERRAMVNDLWGKVKLGENAEHKDFVCRGVWNKRGMGGIMIDANNSPLKRRRGRAPAVRQHPSLPGRVLRRGRSASAAASSAVTNNAAANVFAIETDITRDVHMGAQSPRAGTGGGTMCNGGSTLGSMPAPARAEINANETENARAAHAAMAMLEMNHRAGTGDAVEEALPSVAESARAAPEAAPAPAAPSSSPVPAPAPAPAAAATATTAARAVPEAAPAPAAPSSAPVPAPAPAAAAAATTAAAPTSVAARWPLGQEPSLQLNSLGSMGLSTFNRNLQNENIPVRPPDPSAMGNMLRPMEHVNFQDSPGGRSAYSLTSENSVVQQGTVAGAPAGGEQDSQYTKRAQMWYDDPILNTNPDLVYFRDCNGEPPAFHPIFAQPETLVQATTNDKKNLPTGDRHKQSTWAKWPKPTLKLDPKKPDYLFFIHGQDNFCIDAYTAEWGAPLLFQLFPPGTVDGGYDKQPDYHLNCRICKYKFKTRTQYLIHEEHVRHEGATIDDCHRAERVPLIERRLLGGQTAHYLSPKTLAMMLLTVSNDNINWGQRSGGDSSLPFRYFIKDPAAIVITEMTGGARWDSVSTWLGKNLVEKGIPCWKKNTDLPTVVKVHAGKAAKARVDDISRSQEAWTSDLIHLQWLKPWSKWPISLRDSVIQMQKRE